MVWVGACTAADSVLLAASDGLVTRFRTDDAQARMAPVITAKNACGTCAAAVPSSLPAFVRPVEVIVTLQGMPVGARS